MMRALSSIFLMVNPTDGCGAGFGNLEGGGRGLCQQFLEDPRLVAK